MLNEFFLLYLGIGGRGLFPLKDKCETLGFLPKWVSSNWMWHGKDPNHEPT